MVGPLAFFEVIEIQKHHFFRYHFRSTSLKAKVSNVRIQIILVFKNSFVSSFNQAICEITPTSVIAACLQNDTLLRYFLDFKRVEIERCKGRSKTAAGGGAE